MVGGGNIMCGMELCTQGTVMTVCESLCVSASTCSPDVCVPVSVHMCARIKSFPPIPSLSIMFRGCSSFLSV